jgi:hypothetical protein
MVINERLSTNRSTPSVAFINPPGPSRLYRSTVCTYISKANYIWQPQDFVTLSAHIPHEYTLDFFDCVRDHKTQEMLFDEVNLSPYKVVIVAISSIVYDQDIDFLKRFRAYFPDLKILVTGDILLEKIFWENVLEYADGLVLNSIDIDLAHYINEKTSNSPHLILKHQATNEPKAEGKAHPKQVSIGIPRHELFISKKYRFPFVRSYLYSTVSSQFGCPYGCNYCSWCEIPVVYRKYDEVLEEIATIHRLGVQDIFFGDPSFGFPRDNAVLMLEGMIRKNFSMRWVCYANPGLLDDEVLQLMKSAGCHTVIIGIDDENVDLLKAKYDRNLSKSKLIAFCHQCLQLDIRICGDFIIGLDSDKTAVNRMIQFAKLLHLDYASFNIFTPLLGSKMRKILVSEGILDPYTIGFDTSGTFGQGNEKLIQLRNMAIKQFYLRPGYLLRRMMNITSVTECMIQLEEMIAMLKHHVLKKYHEA